MECSAEHVCHLHLLIESDEKVWWTDGQTDAGQKKESLSAYHATQGDTKTELSYSKQLIFF